MSDFRALDRTAASQFGVLTTDQLRAAGLTKNQIDHQIRTGRFQRRAGGIVVIAGAPPSWDQNVSAAALAARPLGAASHRSAARIWKFRTVDDEIEISVRYPRRLAIPGVIVHRSCDLTANDLTWVGETPVTTPERTICDLGLIFPPTEVLRILRHAVATGLVDERELLRMRIRIGKQGRNGAGVVGWCLDQLPDGAELAESGPEVMFLEMCVTFGLPQPAIQHPVMIDGCHYRLDFAFPAARVCIEIDGADTHSAPEQIASDGGRQNALVAAGWRPVRFDYLTLKNSPEYCVAVIRTLLGDL